LARQALDFLEQLDTKQYRQVGKTIFRLLGAAEPAGSQALKGAAHNERRVDVGKRNGDEVYRMWKRK
jgi:hypothetical protein